MGKYRQKVVLAKDESDLEKLNRSLDLGWVIESKESIAVGWLFILRMEEGSTDTSEVGVPLDIPAWPQEAGYEKKRFTGEKLDCPEACNCLYACMYL